MKLNAGCGYKYKKGWINLDNQSEANVDILADLNKKLPFKDGVFDEILADNVLEHIDDIILCMNEFHRTMKKKGLLTIVVPCFPTHGSVCDPTHKRYFIRDSFPYFTHKGKLPGIKLWDWHGPRNFIPARTSYSSSGQETMFLTAKLIKP